jgi:hypothetical protein
LTRVTRSQYAEKSANNPVSTAAPNETDAIADRSMGTPDRRETPAAIQQAAAARTKKVRNPIDIPEATLSARSHRFWIRWLSIVVGTNAALRSTRTTIQPQPAMSSKCTKVQQAKPVAVSNRVEKEIIIFRMAAQR